MKFVTREHARIDRIACPWLIRRFIDPAADISWVPSEEVLAFAEANQAEPFDIPDVELGHSGANCSFDAFIAKFGLGGDPALRRLADIVRAADTASSAAAPEAPGLVAIATGFWHMEISDEERLAMQSPVYDALYTYCERSV